MQIKTSNTQDTYQTVIGLDGETSSDNIQTGGQLIQAGFAVSHNGKLQTFTSLIKPEVQFTDQNWQEEAAAVHKITKEQLQTAPSAKEVDEAAYLWLTSVGISKPEQGIAVGFNVAEFDFPFFRRDLPKTMKLISRRSIDLNSVCLTLDGHTAQGSAQAKSWTEYKAQLKQEAATHLRQVPEMAGKTEHDAGYDAALALLGWDWLRQNI